MSEQAVDECKDLFEYMLSIGYTPQEAQRVSILKIKYSDYDRVGMEGLTLRKHIPLWVVEKVAPWDEMEEVHRRSVLWNLGLDTKEYKYFLDAGCYSWAEGIECGAIVVGNERTDVEWSNLVIEGCNMASMDARLIASGDYSLQKELEYMQRTNKKG